MTTETQATREYLENRIFEKAIEDGVIRRPIGFGDRPQLKESLYEQFVSDDPLAGAVPVEWEGE